VVGGLAVMDMGEWRGCAVGVRIERASVNSPRPWTELAKKCFCKGPLGS